MNMVPGLSGDVFGFEASRSTQMPEIHCAQVLARICDRVLRDYAPDLALLVNYRELPGALWTRVLPHFGVSCSADDRAAIAEAARYDAKSPGLPFSEDTETKRNAATDQIRAAAQQLCRLHADRKEWRDSSVSHRDETTGWELPPAPSSQ
jgi:hypothetical protein